MSEPEMLPRYIAIVGPNGGDEWVLIYGVEGDSEVVAFMSEFHAKKLETRVPPEITQWLEGLPNPDWWQFAPKRTWRKRIAEMEAEIFELKKAQEK